MQTTATWCSFAALSFALSVTAACSQATFGGRGASTSDSPGESSPGESDPGSTDSAPTVPGDKGGPSDAEASADPLSSAELGISCETWEDQQAEIDAPPGLGRVRLKGEICRVRTASVGVVLLVDTSTSMKKSDPLENGSCGRLRAAEALVRTVSESLGSAASFSLVTFADFGTVTWSAKSGEEALDLVAPESLCAASGQTNYAAALVTARDELARNGSEQLGLYLISDGLPDVFSQKDPLATGLEKAEDLRVAFPDLRFNALYFGVPQAGSDPKAYLEKVVGQAGEVKIVDRAEELAAAIVAVAPPEGLSRDAFRVDVTWAGGAVLSVSAESLLPVPGSSGHVEFTTEPFDLSARQGAERLLLTWRSH